MNRLVIIFSIAVLLFIGGCTSDPRPDVSHIEVDIDIPRFEKAVFSLDTNTIVVSIDKVYDAYPEVSDLYFEKVMNFMKRDRSGQLDYEFIKKFVTNEALLGLMDTVETHYPDLSEIEQELEEAFRYHTYYFPESKTPKIVSWISEFGPAVSSLDSSVIGISLDMYLGADYVYYPSLEFPRYMYRNFTSEYIPINVMKSVWQYASDWDEKNKRLIDHMVERGKELYYLEKVLPDTEKHKLLGYSKEEYQWCKDNAVQMWEFFIEKELLYSDNPRDFMKYVKEGPTSSGMPNESPGNTASWLGWQIVKAFVGKSDDMTLKNLKDVSDGQKVLVKSKYKP